MENDNINSKLRGYEFFSTCHSDRRLDDLVNFLSWENHFLDFVNGFFAKMVD